MVHGTATHWLKCYITVIQSIHLLFSSLRSISTTWPTCSTRRNLSFWRILPFVHRQLTNVHLNGFVEEQEYNRFVSISFRGIHVSIEVQFSSLFNTPKSYCPCSICSTRRQPRSVTFLMKAYVYMCIPLSTRKVLRNLQQTIDVREGQGHDNFGLHHIQLFR